MVDTLTTEQRRERMSRIRGKDTGPELKVRRLLYAMGFRYRLHRRDLPGSPDLVFPGKQKVIFVHGCFWHRHPDPTCRLARLPKSRTDFWVTKLTSNRDRDLRNQKKLAESGWRSMVVWECQLRDEEAIKRKLTSFLEEER